MMMSYSFQRFRIVVEANDRDAFKDIADIAELLKELGHKIMLMFYFTSKLVQKDILVLMSLQ
jgi:hypothetical protein